MARGKVPPRGVPIDAAAVRGDSNPNGAGERIPTVAGEAAAPGRDAAALPGLSVVTQDWEGDIVELARRSRGVLIAAEGWPDGRLAALLDRLRDEVALHDRIVVSFTEVQTDLVAAALLGTGVELLCSPSAVERAGALIRASGLAGDRTNDPSGDEAARLAAIAAEVARIAEALGGIARREVIGTSTAADRRMSFDAADAPDLPVTAAQVRLAIRARRTRDAIFGAGWFEEPAWDMLLDLFAAELEGTRVSVSSLCIAAAVAQTTALRWITKMIGAGLLEREDDPADRRRAFMTLSGSAAANMRRYFASVQRLRLAVP